MRALVSLLVLAVAGAVHGASDVVKLNDENFDELTAATSGAQGAWFVKFFAPWCGHCKALAPKWEELATSLKGNVNIADADCTGGAEDNCERFGVKGFPTLIYFKDGKQYSYEGAREVKDLKEFVESGFSKAEGAAVPRLPTAFDKAMKDVYLIDDHMGNLWAQSKMAWFVIFGLGVAVGFVAKSFTTPKSKERVKVVIKDKKK